MRAESGAEFGESEAGKIRSFSRPRDIAILFGISIFLVLCTRLPFVPRHLYSFDTVNMALALTDFDPTRHQPQPPGYPFFVAEARLLYPLFGTPERTFAVIGSLISGLALGMIYLLGSRMFSPGAGLAAAALLFVNPVFWFSGLTSPLRPHLALVSILVAYCCWRSLQGESRYFYAASVALGLGSGFRPELLLLLFPLWVWTGWNCRGQKGRLSRGCLLLGVTALSWIIVVIIASGGFARTLQTLSEYTFAQTEQTSVLLSPRSYLWLRSAARAVLWSGLGAVPWLWAMPFGWLRWRQMTGGARYLGFLALWFLPPFIFYLIVHIGDPDQTLSIIPILCLLGAFSLVAAEQTIARKWIPEIKEMRGILIWIALVGNLMLFFKPFILPEASPPGFRGLRSVKDLVLRATYESSYPRVMWVDQMTVLGLQQVRNLKSSTNRPLVMFWAGNGVPVWRKLAFYLPSEKVYSLDEAGDPASPISMAQLWSGGTMLEKYSGTVPIQVPVPKEGRLIWIVGPGEASGLRQVVSLQDAPPVFYTDLPADAPSFRWGSFEFTPQ